MLIYATTYEPTYTLVPLLVVVAIVTRDHHHSTAGRQVEVIIIVSVPAHSDFMLIEPVPLVRSVELCRRYSSHGRND